jgi:hypothetical protein
MRSKSTSPSTAAEPTTEEPAWVRNRRLRLAQIEAEQEHGKHLVEGYGREVSRPTFAAMKPTKWRRRRG